MFEDELKQPSFVPELNEFTADVVRHRMEHLMLVSRVDRFRHLAIERALYDDELTCDEERLWRKSKRTLATFEQRNVCKCGFYLCQ